MERMHGLWLLLAALAVGIPFYLSRYRYTRQHEYNPYKTVDRHPVSYAAAMSWIPRHSKVRAA